MHFNKMLASMLPTARMSLEECVAIRNKLIAAAARGGTVENITIDKNDPQVQAMLRTFAAAIQTRQAAKKTTGKKELRIVPMKD